MRIFKKIFFSLIFVCAFSLGVVIVYCFIPTGAVNVDNFAPREELAFLKLSIDKKNISLSDDIIDFRFAEEFLIESWFKRIFLKIGARFFSPMTVRVLVDKGRDQDDFGYMVLVQSSKLSRFMQIPFSIYSAGSSFRKDYGVEQVYGWQIYSSKEDNSDLKAVAVQRDVWLFVIKTNKAAEIIERLNEDENAKSVGSVNFLTFLAEKGNEPFLLYVNDENKILNFYLSKVREKTSYDFFPTVSNLDEIFVCFGKTALKHKGGGEMNFYFEKEADLQNAKKDIWFLSQVLKRMFEANFYQYEYNIEVTVDKVTAHFALTKTRRE